MNPTSRKAFSRYLFVVFLVFALSSTTFYLYRRPSELRWFVLIALVCIILYNIWKMYRHEKNLIYHTAHAEKNAASKAAFLAGMSHEIRTPLNSIIGFSEQLSMSELNEIQREQLDAICRSSKTLLDIVNQVLDFSKIDTGKMVFEQDPFKPREVFEEVFNTLRIQASNKGIGISKSLNFPANLTLKGDALRLKQVLINLLGNAIKFTKQGGVSLKASITSGKKNFVSLVVKVKDTGIGISKDDVHLIFGEFDQVASAQKDTSHTGTGLGLAISKKIIEQQGGYIHVSSKEGSGSIFKFSLPCEINFARETARPAKDNTTGIDLSMLRGRRLLLAEDNELNVLLLNTILKKWNIDFDIVHNGVEALDLYESSDYDVVITDIEMPEMGGIELTDRIRSAEDQQPGVPIIALTANVFKEDHDQYISAGMDGVILKPFSEQSLFTGIISVLEKSRACAVDAEAAKPIPVYTELPLVPTTRIL